MPTGFMINGVDMEHILAFNGTLDDTSTFRSTFMSTSPASFGRTKFNPSNCSISNSANIRYNCYKVPDTFGTGRYTTPTAPGNWSLAGVSWRWNGNFQPAIGQTDGPQTSYNGLYFPNWTKSILVYSVGGGGGGGGKGDDTTFHNSGNGVDGANGQVTVGAFNVFPGQAYSVIVGGGGSGGAGTGNDAGKGGKGTPSYVYTNENGILALALGGVGGNEGNSASPVKKGSDGELQNATTNNIKSDVAWNPPVDYPPTLQQSRGSNGGGIGGYGNGQGSNQNTAGSPGNSGMVAIFFKSTSV